MQATEQKSFEEVFARLPQTEKEVKILLARLNQIRSLKEGETVVDIGAAHGSVLIGCARQGFKAIGIEPWDKAREVGEKLADHTGVKFTLLPGKAEEIPLPSESSDIVLARSVLEHVIDVKAAFREIYRILKSNGIFWFYTVSSLCPSQQEISGFPLFGWYPDRLKIKIMNWVKIKKPHLVGYSKTPAINWFNPWKTRRMLHEVGFTRIYDRWDLRLPSEGGILYRAGLKIIRSNPVTKVMADVFIVDCSYAGVK